MSKYKGLKIKGVMGEYTLKQQLAQGGFAVIYLTDNEDVICKLQNLSAPASDASFRREKSVLVAVKHPNIVRLVDWAEIELKQGKFGVLLLENCSKGNLFKLLESTKGDLPELTVLGIFHAVASALEAMHRYGYSHRDVKLENVLINKAGQYKLCDFGSVTQKVVSQVDKNNRLTIEEDIEKNTTPIYRAPEQLDLYSNFEIGPKVDVFALGCVVFMLCFKKQPFEMRLSAINNHFFMPDNCGYSEDLKDLIRKCFTPNPQNRPTSSTLLKELKPLMSVTDSKVRKNEHKFPVVLENELQRVHNEFAHVRPSNKAMESVKASLLDRMRRAFTQMTTETESWIGNFIEESESSPPLKYTRNIIAKCWAKPYKVEKVYSIMLEATNQNINKCIVILKLLVLLHNFLRKGPREAIVGPNGGTSQSTAVRICMLIVDHWKRINANDRSEDLRRQPYVSLLIQYYSLVIVSKVKLCDTYACFIQGNYCPLPYFQSTAEQKILSPRFVQDLLRFLEKLIDLHERVEQFSSLPNIQRTILLSLVDEQYCLVSFLVHLYCTLKLATNYLYGQRDLDHKALLEKLQQLDAQLIALYSRLLKLIELDAGRYATDMGGQFVGLRYEVIGHIKGIKVLELEQARTTFNLSKQLSFEANLYGLSLPHTYEDVFNAAMEGVNTHPFSANVQNFIDLSAFRVQKERPREVPKKIELESSQAARVDTATVQPKRQRPKQQSNPPVKGSPHMLIPPVSTNPEPNIWNTDFFSRTTNKQQPANTNFQQFMDFSHQNLNKEFSASKIQQNIAPASSNTLAEYFIEQPSVPRPANNDLMNVEEPKPPGSRTTQLEQINCELIRFDDDQPSPPTLNLQEVLKPLGRTPPKSDLLQLDLTPPREKKFDVTKLNSIQFQPSEQPNSKRQKSLTPRSPTANIKGFIMEEVSRNANQFLIDFNELDFHRKVGAGTSSEVFQGTWRGQEVAIKKLKLANPHLVKEFERQIMTCVKIRPHPHIASMIGVCERSEPEEMYIISQFCHGGTLFELLHESKVPVNWATKVSIAKQIAKGMLFLHSNQPPTIHRDLKSLNILLTDLYTCETDKVRIKIADFGLSRDMSQDFMTGRLGTYVMLAVTQHWMAPQIIDNQPYSTKADVYSFAIVLWQIITRRLPYKNIEHAQAIMKFVTVQNGRPEITFISSRCPKQMRDLMIRCWDADPRQRPEFKQILYILGTIATQ